MFHSIIFLGALYLGTASMPSGGTEVPDTIATAVVSAQKCAVVSRVDTVKVGGSVTESFTESLSRIPGLQINDYGGMSAIKNISIRGMGSTHTSVLVDGVKVENAQSGQIDLGMLGLENVGSYSVDYVGSKVNLVTAAPQFADGKDFGGRLSVNAGSFGTYAPSARFDFRLPGNLVLSVNGRYESSDGDFTYGDGTRRIGNDIRQFRGGADLYGGIWKMKFFYNKSERGVPGSVTWPATDRQMDRNVFVQGTVHKKFTGAYTLDARAKVAWDRMHYDGEGYSNWYDQMSLTLGSAHRFTVTDWWNVTADVEARRNNLHSDLFGAGRTSVDVKAMSSFGLERMKADVSLDWSGNFDDGGVRHNCVSPSVGLRYEAASWLDFVGTFRRAYRVPTFNDLYYTGMGNPDLLPEDAWMSGLEAEAHFSSGAWRFRSSFDAFYNSLKNKIISAPTEDPYLWMMYNLGEAEVYGLDSMMSLRYESSVSAGVQAGYTWQGGTPVPYQARGCANVTADVKYQGWSAAVRWCRRGVRQDSYGVEMLPYSLLDLTFGKSWKKISAELSVKNLLDREYEIITGYPMPGINFIAGIQYRF